MHLRANTITIVTVGPAVTIADGYTPVTNLDVSTADQAEIIKHGASAVTDISGATWAALTGCAGYYSLTITASLSDTEGQLLVVVQDESLSLPIKEKFQVLSQAAYDSLYGAKDAGFMDVNIKTIGRADAQETEAANLEAACAAYSITRGLTGTALPAAVADLAGGLPISDAGGLDIDKIDDIWDDTSELVADDIPGLIGALNDIAVADITGVEVDNDGTAISLAGAFKLILSALTGKSSGGGTTVLNFKDINDTKTRISCTVDVDGNRDSVGTRDAT